MDYGCIFHRKSIKCNANIYLGSFLGTVAYLVDVNVLTPIKKNWNDFIQGRNE